MMARGNIVSTLILVVVGLVGTVVIAVVGGWAAIQAGLGQIVAIGAGLLAAAIAVLGFLGLGGKSGTTSVETTVNIDEDDLQVRLQRDNREKETNPRRANFPERWAKFLRARGWGYEGVQRAFKILITAGVFTVVVFGGSLVTLVLGRLGGNVPLQLIALSEWMFSVFGVGLMWMITAAGVMATGLLMVGYVELSRVFRLTTCDECGRDFCLSFEYALYVPGSGEEHYDKVYDNEGNVKGTEVSGYTYKGPLYATCTTRDELVEREGWSWYVSM